MDIVASWNWFATQSLGTQILIVVGILNIAIAGLKQLGLTQLADLCSKIEAALLAMTSAAKTAFITELKKPKIEESKNDTK
jgi:hypothetical protein